MVSDLTIRAQFPQPPVKKRQGSRSLNLTRRLDRMLWYTSGFQ